MKKVIMLLAIGALSSSVLAQGNGNGNNNDPNGQPFQNLQDQVDATNTAINEAQAATSAALEAAEAASVARDELLQQGLDSTNAAQAAAVSALEATDAALQATDAALQARDDTLQAGLDAATAAQAATASALEAAEAALQARDDLLQEQIDLLSLSLTEQMSIFNARFTELEEQIAEVALESEEGDALLLSKIELLVVAVEALEGRADAVDLYNIYQDELINTLETRVDSLDQSTAINQQYALQQYRLLADRINSARSRADMAYNLAYSANNTANAAYSLASNNNYQNLSNRLQTVENKIGILDNALARTCNYGYYMAGVTLEGRILCREVLDRATVSKNLERHKVCITDSFLGCLDYDHWQSGNATCPSGMIAVGVSYSGVPGGVRTAEYYTYSAYVRSKNTNSREDDVGVVTVHCSTYPLNEIIKY